MGLSQWGPETPSNTEENIFTNSEVRSGAQERSDEILWSSWETMSKFRVLTTYPTPWGDENSLYENLIHPQPLERLESLEVRLRRISDRWALPLPRPDSQYPVTTLKDQEPNEENDTHRDDMIETARNEMSTGLCQTLIGEGMDESMSMRDKRSMAHGISSHNLLEAWKEMPLAMKRESSSFILSALKICPMSTLAILEHSMNEKDFILSPSVIQDSLYYITCHSLLYIESPPRDVVERICQAAISYLTSYGGRVGPVRLHHHTLWLLTLHCELPTLLSFLDSLRNAQSYISENTRLHLIKRLITFDKLDLALEELGKVTPRESIFTEELQSVCVRLLRQPKDHDKLYNLRSNMLAHMLQFGIQPNRQMHNVILLNAMEAGDRVTAWRSYEITREHGLRPDIVTYAILLKGAQHGDSRSTISAIFRNAEQDGLLPNRRFSFEYMYALFLAEQNVERYEPYTALLPIYSEVFDTSPLEDLGFAVPTKEMGNDEAILVDQTATAALGLMVLAWLRQHSHDGDILSAFLRYEELVKSKHPQIKELAKTTYAANAFIHAFGANRATVGLCTSVVKHMNSYAKPAAPAGPNDTVLYSPPDTDPVVIAKPDIITWSILLFAFARNGQMRAAERVLSLMKGHNIQPGLVTFNSLASGYAHSQDIAGMVRTLQRMDSQDIGLDDYSMKALAKFMDKEELMRAIRQAKEQKL
jgi:pentatricopeptide repeat protein